MSPPPAQRGDPFSFYSDDGDSEGDDSDSEGDDGATSTTGTTTSVPTSWHMVPGPRATYRTSRSREPRLQARHVIQRAQAPPDSNLTTDWWKAAKQIIRWKKLVRKLGSPQRLTAAVANWTRFMRRFDRELVILDWAQALCGTAYARARRLAGVRRWLARQPEMLG